MVHYDFAGLQNHFAALHYDFVAVQNRFVVLNYGFVKVQNHFSRMQYDFSGVRKGLGNSLGRPITLCSPKSTSSFRS